MKVDVPPYRTRLVSPPPPFDPERVDGRFVLLGKPRDRATPADMEHFTILEASMGNSLENRVARLERAMKERDE